MNDHDPIQVRTAEASHAVAWDRYVRAHPDSTGYQLWGWGEVFSTAMGLKVHRLAAWRGGDLAGVLPLAQQRLWPLAPSLISLPFVNYAGVLASDPAAESGLLEEAVRLARSVGAGRVELRHDRARAGAWARREDKARFVIDVSAGEDRVWEALPGPRRTQTRRALREGLTAEAGGETLLEEFYGLVAREWLDHGSPILPRRFFTLVLRSFPDDCRICLVRSGPRPVAAGLLYRFGARVENPWLGALPEFASRHATTLLCWSMIQESCRWGAELFDFGRSTRGSGPYIYKERWGGREELLPWSVWPAGAAAAPEATRNAELIKSMWKRLPIRVANQLGPLLARQLPL